MRTSFDLKFYSDGIVFSFTKWPFQTITLKNVSTLYWKCLASNTGFKLSYLHLSKKSISFILSSGNSSTHYSAIIKRISFQCKSALLRVCLQYFVILLIVLIKRYTLYFTRTDWNVFAKPCGIIPSVAQPRKTFLCRISIPLFKISCCATDNA